MKILTPKILKILHFSLLPLGVYVAAQSEYKLKPADWSENHFRELTVNKTRAVSASIALLVFIFAQLAMLYKFHDFGMDVNHFKIGYFTFSVVNVILSANVIAEFSEILRLNESTSPGTNGPLGVLATMIVGLVFGSLALLFNMANLYHISTLTGISGKRMSPRRK